MLLIRVLLVALMTSGCVLPSVQAGDKRLLGVWKAVSYTIGGVDHPLIGTMIFTPAIYSATTLYGKGPDGNYNANANTGPYRVQDGRITFVQWVQLHYRPTDPKETFAKPGPDEESSYSIEGDKLTIGFPSGNKYVLERMSEMSTAMTGSGENEIEGLWSYTTIQAGGGKEVPIKGLFLFHNGRFAQQAVNDAEPFDRQLGQAHFGTYSRQGNELKLEAAVGIIVDPTQSQPYTSRAASHHELTVKRSGDSLELTFGTGTIQKFRRVRLAQPAAELIELEKGVLALFGDRFLLISEQEGLVMAGSGSFKKSGDRITLKAEPWFSARGDKVDYARKRELKLVRKEGGLEFADGSAHLKIRP